jgi:hypothetical protein
MTSVLGNAVRSVNAAGRDGYVMASDLAGRSGGITTVAATLVDTLADAGAGVSLIHDAASNNFRLRTLSTVGGISLDTVSVPGSVVIADSGATSLTTVRVKSSGGAAAGAEHQLFVGADDALYGTVTLKKIRAADSSVIVHDDGATIALQMVGTGGSGVRTLVNSGALGTKLVLPKTSQNLSLVKNLAGNGTVLLEDAAKRTTLSSAVTLGGPIVTTVSSSAAEAFVVRSLAVDGTTMTLTDNGETVTLSCAPAIAVNNLRMDGADSASVVALSKSISLGSGSSVSGAVPANCKSALAVGRNAAVVLGSAGGGLAIGPSAASDQDGIAVGSAADAEKRTVQAIGAGAAGTAGSVGATVYGSGSSAIGDYGVAVGRAVETGATDAVLLGSTYAVALDADTCNLSFDGELALTVSDSVFLGAGYHCQQGNSFVFDVDTADGLIPQPSVYDWFRVASPNASIFLDDSLANSAYARTGKITYAQQYSDLAWASGPHIFKYPLQLCAVDTNGAMVLRLPGRSDYDALLRAESTVDFGPLYIHNTGSQGVTVQFSASPVTNRLGEGTFFHDNPIAAEVNSPYEDGVGAVLPNSTIAPAASTTVLWGRLGSSGTIRALHWYRMKIIANWHSAFCSFFSLFHDARLLQGQPRLPRSDRHCYQRTRVLHRHLHGTNAGDARRHSGVPPERRLDARKARRRQE